jgi:hypothetical protein
LAFLAGVCEGVRWPATSVLTYQMHTKIGRSIQNASESIHLIRQSGGELQGTNCHQNMKKERHESVDLPK